MPQFSYTALVLEDDVWQGPAQITLEDKTNVESDLREEPTTARKNGWSEQPYDFPNSYVTLPLRVLEWNPITTFSDYQNERFAQRYYNKGVDTFNR